MSLLFGMRRAILLSSGSKRAPEPPEEPEEPEGGGAPEGAGGDVMALSFSMPEVVMTPELTRWERFWERFKLWVVDAWRWVCAVLRDAWEGFAGPRL